MAKFIWNQCWEYVNEIAELIAIVNCMTGEPHVAERKRSGKAMDEFVEKTI